MSFQIILGLLGFLSHLWALIIKIICNRLFIKDGYKLSDFVRFSQGNSLLLKAFLIEPALFSQLSVPNSYDLVSFIKQTWCDILDEINNFIIWTWKNRWEWGCFTGTCCRLLGCVTCRLLWWTAVQMFAVSVQAQLVTSVKSAEWDGHSTTTPV